MQVLVWEQHHRMARSIEHQAVLVCAREREKAPRRKLDGSRQVNAHIAMPFGSWELLAKDARPSSVHWSCGQIDPKERPAGKEIGHAALRSSRVTTMEA